MSLQNILILSRHDNQSLSILIDGYILDLNLQANNSEVYPCGADLSCRHFYPIMFSDVDHLNEALFSIPDLLPSQPYSFTVFSTSVKCNPILQTQEETLAFLDCSPCHIHDTRFTAKHSTGPENLTSQIYSESHYFPHHFHHHIHGQRHHRSLIELLQQPPN